jgi:hypothetical protein
MLSYVKEWFKGNDYPIHIVAGNFSEFQDFVIKKRQMGFLLLSSKMMEK